jgi:hypothetical protein
MSLYRKEHIAVGRKRKKGKWTALGISEVDASQEIMNILGGIPLDDPDTRGDGRVGGASGSGVPELNSWIGRYPRWWHDTYCLSLLFANPFGITGLANPAKGVTQSS